MSKKTEANLDRIQTLEDQVMVDVPDVSGYGSRYIKIDKVVGMILDHLGLVYERAVPSSSRLVRPPKKK